VGIAHCCIQLLLHQPLLHPYYLLPRPLPGPLPRLLLLLLLP
jgi:hypothetical protein